MTANVSSPPPRLAELCPQAPPQLVKLVDSMLAKKPSSRPQSPMRVAEQLMPLAKGNDLKQLAHQAEQSEPTEPPCVRSVDTTPPAQPFLRRRVPVGLLIATALAALATGFFLGIIVKIKYPDGTEARIRVPDGGTVEIVPDESGRRHQGESGLGLDNEERGSSTTGTSTEEYAPLFFAILAEHQNDEAVSLAMATLEKSIDANQGKPVRTAIGIWYPTADNLTAPIKSELNGQRYALIELSNDARVRWKDIKGHMDVSTMNRGGGRADVFHIDMEFDYQLAAKMKQLSQANINRQLAIVFNNRIISAPHIRTWISNRAQISGRLTGEEIRYLMQALRGGLVEPLASDLPSSFTERLQGLWQVTSAKDGGNEFHDSNLMMAFDRDRFYLVEDDQIEGAGTFELNKQVPLVDGVDDLFRGDIVAIDLHD